MAKTEKFFFVYTKSQWEREQFRFLFLGVVIKVTIQIEIPAELICSTARLLYIFLY